MGVERSPCRALATRGLGHQAPELLRRDKVSSSDGYPFSLPAIRGPSKIDFRSAPTFLVGENGRARVGQIAGRTAQILPR